MGRELTNDQMNESVRLLKNEVDRKSSASVKAALRNVNPSTGIWPSMVEAVSAKIVESGEYVRTAKDEDYFIQKNPNYSKKGFWQRNPFFEKLAIAVISGGISLMVGLTIAKQSKQSQNLIDKRQDSLIKAVSDSLSNFEKHTKDSNLHN